MYKCECGSNANTVCNAIDAALGIELNIHSA